MDIKYYHNNLPIIIRRHKRRRHILLQVESQSILIKAPTYSSTHEIFSFIDEHRSWIEKRIESLPKAQSFTHGAYFYHLGVQKKLDIAKGVRSCLFEHDKLTIRFASTHPKAIATVLYAALLKEANCLLKKRTQLLAAQANLIPTSISIKNYKARWGACDVLGNIQLNWRLILCPLSTIDYVITHELVHLKHFDHSKAFWSLVQYHMPNYLVHKRWLNLHVDLLRIKFDVG